jgi:hypothetical protein
LRTLLHLIWRALWPDLATVRMASELMRCALTAPTLVRKLRALHPAPEFESLARTYRMTEAAVFEAIMPQQSS